MNKVAVGTILFAIIVLAILFRTIVFPLVSSLAIMFNSTVYGFTKPSTPDLMPVTHTVLVTLYNWLLYIFTNPMPLAILLAISILIMLIEYEWRK